MIEPPVLATADYCFQLCCKPFIEKPEPKTTTMPFIFLNHEKLEQTENKIIIWDESYETNFGIKQLPYDYGKTMMHNLR